MVKLLAAAAALAVAGFTLGGTGPASAEPMPSPKMNPALSSGVQQTGCITPASAISYLVKEGKVRGSKFLVLTDGIQQEFADAWRWRFDANPVPVALVVARIYRPSKDADARVETIEFGMNGCAMTWTSMPAGDFLSIMQSMNATAV